jgi:hypothetical protein
MCDRRSWESNVSQLKVSQLKVSQLKVSQLKMPPQRVAERGARNGFAAVGVSLLVTRHHALSKQYGIFRRSYACSHGGMVP